MISLSYDQLDHSSVKLYSLSIISAGLNMFSVPTYDLLSNNETINHIQYNNDMQN